MSQSDFVAADIYKSPSDAGDIHMLDSVSLRFKERSVLEDVSLTLPAHRMTCLIGPSGCGKTSILNMISGLLPASSGTVHRPSERVGYIFQEDRLLPWETVYDNVRLVREDEDSEEITSLLEALALTGFENAYPHQLSGGMRQRCALARGFYFHGDLLLMDEPFKSLDYDLRLSLIAYLGKLWKRHGNTILFVTHDIDEALLLGHRIVVLSKRPTRIVRQVDIPDDLEKRSLHTVAHAQRRAELIAWLSQDVDTLTEVGRAL